MTPREILEEFARGCSNTTYGKSPWSCDECRESMMSALTRAVCPEEAERVYAAVEGAMNPKLNEELIDQILKEIWR